ncbi:hypothetical protein KXD93_30150 [Mucilaginibacter sp. BJC16-A38]|uniref:hypothetical protein n=1 Tax=Mucilaginibacter phenanthrenivorans TaxID=1234842 RepID=UPI0021572F1E|nr:hypothetical protein [Mucilaginibacter phenanthrenivorans]MCR8561955.1 hypothetical protein [Mucilaginibacter phenanthrenivorans]
MLNAENAKVIGNLFNTLDQGVRNDLSRGQIADERDYVSRLVTHFNYPYGLFNTYSVGKMKFDCGWFARVNKGESERGFGCDSMIIFRVGDKVKVGLFEAKWPRIMDYPDYPWDYLQKSSKQSHFTSQIERQSNWSDNAAIWEMFFYENEIGKTDGLFDKNGSTCIKHDFANAVIDSTERPALIWDNDDLENLLIKARTAGEETINIGYILEEILTCKLGKAIEIDETDRYFTLYENDGKKFKNIPIVRFPGDPQLRRGDNTLTGIANDELITGFMQANGLSFLQFMNIKPKQNDIG